MFSNDVLNHNAMDETNRKISEGETETTSTLKPLSENILEKSVKYKSNISRDKKFL